MEAMSRPGFYLLVCAALWSTSVISLSVFSDAPKAHMLLRSRRANSFLEELKPPSMERECVEEKCNFEEAREIFLTREATLEFWTVYTDGNQCQSNMCVHGECVDQYQDYKCLCHPGYEGKYCQNNSTATNCTMENGYCDHECTESEDGQRRTCSCLKGYNLENDSRKCSPKSTSSCGQILINRSEYSEPVDGLLPWTVGGRWAKGRESLAGADIKCKGAFHCGGVLIDENWVLTAAHCLENNYKFSVRLGDYERKRNEGTEVVLRVSETFKHPKYNSITVDNDIALLRLQSPAPFSKYILPICLPGRSMAERVLHLNGTTTVVTGWGKDDTGKHSSALNFIKVPLINHTFCSQLMLPHELSNNVLCAGILGKSVDACEGDSGGPMVTRYRNTWFLVGLVSWGEGCGKTDKLGIYTKVSNYNEWIAKYRKNGRENITLNSNELHLRQTIPSAPPYPEEQLGTSMMMLKILLNKHVNSKEASVCLFTTTDLNSVFLNNASLTCSRLLKRFQTLIHLVSWPVSIWGIVKMYFILATGVLQQKG